MLFVLAIATSIDAFAVGISFGCLHTGVLMPSILIGLITAFVSIVGSTIGKTVAKYARGKAELFGGVILLLIGILKQIIPEISGDLNLVLQKK